MLGGGYTGSIPIVTDIPCSSKDTMYNIPLLDAVSPVAATLGPDLARMFDRLPATVCRRKTACCALLPQMTLLEAGRLMDRVKNMDPIEHRSLLKRLVSYFHLNAARIMGCPFLSDQMCLVYNERPFGCRAYGLWSPQYYRRQAQAALQSRKAVRQAWASMGVRLPQEVLEHQPPYCRDVALEGEGRVTDQDLREVEKSLRELNGRLGVPARDFDHRFYSDLGFLLTAAIWGLDTALKNKVSVVKEYTATGQSPSLEYLIEKIQ